MIELSLGIVSALFGLFLFGILFNFVIGWAKPKGFLEPYMALWVAAGTLVTILGISIIDKLVDWNAGLVALAAFAASGTPMIIGDAVRYVTKMQRELAALRRMELINGQTSETLADQSRVGQN